jgi:hypothetical protein
MAELTLEQHNGPTLHNPSWEDIESALRSIHPKDRGYFILARPGEGYLQTAGARLRLICEWRTELGDQCFRHYVLGYAGRDERLTSINTCVGIIQLRANEIMALDDVVAIFRCNYDEGTVPQSLVRRDDKARFDRFGSG